MSDAYRLEAAVTSCKKRPVVRASEAAPLRDPNASSANVPATGGARAPLIAPEAAKGAVAFYSAAAFLLAY